LNRLCLRLYKGTIMFLPLTATSIVILSSIFQLYDFIHVFSK
jgi:hypothetical protein